MYERISENGLLLFPTDLCCIFLLKVSKTYYFISFCMSVPSIGFVQIRKRKSFTSAVSACSVQLCCTYILVNCSYTDFSNPGEALGFLQRHLLCQKKLCQYSNFLTESNGRTCLPFPFTCWKVFATCQQPKFSKSHEAMPSLTSVYDLSYSHRPRAALSCSVSCGRKESNRCQELWLPIWSVQCGAGGTTYRFACELGITNTRC